MHYTPSIARAFFRLPEQKGEDPLRFSYQGVPHQQCILLPSIAQALVACQSKKGRTCCASFIKAYRTSNAFYSPPSLDLWSLAKARRGGPVALFLSRRTAPAMHFTHLHCSTFGRLLKQEGEDLLRFSYQGVLHPQCILLPSIRGGESRNSGEGVGLFFRMHFPSTSVPSSHPRQT